MLVPVLVLVLVVVVVLLLLLLLGRKAAQRICSSVEDVRRDAWMNIALHSDQVSIHQLLLLLLLLLRDAVGPVTVLEMTSSSAMMMSAPISFCSCSHRCQRIRRGGRRAARAKHLNGALGGEEHLRAV